MGLRSTYRDISLQKILINNWMVPCAIAAKPENPQQGTDQSKVHQQSYKSRSHTRTRLHIWSAASWYANISSCPKTHTRAPAHQHTLHYTRQHTRHHTRLDSAQPKRNGSVTEPARTVMPELLCGNEMCGMANYFILLFMKAEQKMHKYCVD